MTLPGPPGMLLARLRRGTGSGYRSRRSQRTPGGRQCGAMQGEEFAMRPHKGSLSRLLGTSAPIFLIGTLWSPMAAAQTANPPAAEATPQEEGIADIVVTAERRSSSVQDTPIAISAFEGTTLSDQGIVSVEGLSRIAPSLQIYSE